MVSLRSRAVLAVALAAPTLAAAQGLPVRLYPVQGPAAAETLKNARVLVEDGLRNAARRSRTLEPASPLVVPAACGAAPAPACLARLAAGGAVLATTAHDTAGVLVLDLLLVAADGRVAGPARVAIDAYLQSAEPVARALVDLETQLAPRAPPATAAAAEKAPPRAAASDLSPALPPPPPGTSLRPRAPSASDASTFRVDRTAPAGAWKRSAGMALTGVGAALLGGGVGIALANKRLAARLDEKFQAGTLTVADRASYRRVDQYNLATVVLLAAGGATAATGVTLWSIAPTLEPGGFSITGRF